MIRFSFRQSMSAGLLLIVALLGWAGAHGWFLLEQYAGQSRENAELAVQFSTTIQELAERTLDLERSARQYMVLKETSLLERADANASSAREAVGRLAALPGAEFDSLADEWTRTLDAVGAGLRQSGSFDELPSLLGQLARINGEFERQGRDQIDRRQSASLAELDKGRLRLGGLVGVSVAVAILTALLMGWWLSRPVKAIEDAIERLGESRFDGSVDIPGPADLARIGRRLDWLRLRLSELEAERERTLRHVSHELKTPLTALREGVALLQEEIAGPLDGAQREVVDILDANARSLQGHIESLLRLNAVSLGARRLHRRPVDLHRLVDEAVQDRELQIQARHLQIASDVPSERGLLDADKLRVVVDNLLSNAVDFSPDGGTIQLSARIAGDRLTLACIDQGPGVAAEDAERIFAPFVQGHRPALVERQGSGVGLSIVRELIAVMGGKIRLLSAGSAGAHFEIELPWTPAR